MRNLGNRATTVRLVEAPTIGDDQPSGGPSDLLTMLLLDGAAADRWLLREDIAEARDAIARLLGHARKLVRELDRTMPAQACAPVLVRSAARSHG